MAVFIGHNTALAFWRSGRLPQEFALSRVSIEGKIPSREEIQRARQQIGARQTRVLGGLPLLEEQLDVLVGDPAARRNSSVAQCHVWRDPVVGKSFVKIADGCYMSTPEACFLQLAKRLDYVDLLMVGMELCGTFGIDPREPGGFLSRKWSCTPSTRELLQRYAQKATRAHGRAKALRAVRRLANGSASPKEAQLYLLLCLPRCEGGYGLAKPLLNRRVRVVGGEAVVVGEKSDLGLAETRRPDLYWRDSKVALEYESDDWHAGAVGLSRDSKRRGDLEFANVHVVTVTKKQLYRSDLLDKVAHVVARRTGKRVPAWSADWGRLHTELRNKLFADDRRVDDLIYPEMGT